MPPIRRDRRRRAWAAPPATAPSCRRRRAVPRPVLPAAAQRRCRTEADITLAGLEAGPVARCSGATSPSCSTTRPSRWRAACSTRALIAVTQTRRRAGPVRARRLRPGPHPVPLRPTPSSTRSLATLLIPAAVTFVPSFVLVSTLGWVTTLRGLIVPGLFQAFATFLFRQYFLGFPKELEEAARHRRPRLLGHVLADRRARTRPGFVAAIGTITFIGSVERLPLAAGHRPGPELLDGADRAVDLPHRPDGQPAPAVHRRARRDPAAAADVPLPPALDRRGRRAHRHQRLRTAGVRCADGRDGRDFFRPSLSLHTGSQRPILMSSTRSNGGSVTWHPTDHAASPRARDCHLNHPPAGVGPRSGARSIISGPPAPPHRRAAGAAFRGPLRAVTRWCHDERLAVSAASERKVRTMPGNVHPVADEREGLHRPTSPSSGPSCGSPPTASPTSRPAPCPPRSALSVGGLSSTSPPSSADWVDIVLQRPRWPGRPGRARPTTPRASGWGRDETLAGAARRLRGGGPRDRRGLAGARPRPAGARPHGRPWFPRDVDAWSVRWVLLHLIQETARHAGHADIVREHLDGATAFELMAAAEGWPATAG